MPGYDVPGVPFLCMAPLVHLSVSAGSSRRAALRGFLAGMGANLLLFYWIAYTVAVLGKLGWPAGCLATLLVSAYMAIYVSAAGYFLFRLHDRFGQAGLWAFPFVWTGLEYARSVLLTGSPWVLLGYSLSARTVLVQAADLAGVFGLGFLLSGAGVCAYLSGKRLAAGERRAAVLPAAAFSAILAFLLLYGSLRLEGTGPGATDRGLRVGIAQGGIDQTRKWDPSYQSATISIYEALSREAASRGVEVIVWPETAAPFFYGWEGEMSRQVDRIATENGVPLIFGAPWFSPSEGGKYYNSVFLLDGRGVPKGRYDKRHLVPFGEYIPLRPLFSFLQKLTGGGEDFSSGTGPALFPVRGGLAGASVCYEAVFPGIIRDSVRGGAQWLVNVTNDAWFGDTVAPRQHLAMARMRCVEFRRPMVRAANSGISALIDARGEVVASLGLFRSGVVTGEIVPGHGDTVYAKTGGIFAISCTIIAFLILCVLLRGKNGIRAPGRKIRRA
jgi:apolipoprotein N-acyltransferase